MKKTLLFITTFILTARLFTSLFNLGEYDFFVQLDRVTKLPFTNPIDEVKEMVEEVKSITSLGSLDLQWYEYIGKYFQWVGNVFMIPINLVKDFFLNLWYGLQSMLIMLGFNL